ncbi:hypothetical protein, partial [Xanthomonas citri]|uniref:hypothetical protein n=1 Tax=Xanthomonas citri TaxID=346 RepID=UPI001E551F2B
AAHHSRLFRFVNTLISRSFRTLSASGPRLRAAASREANYMPAEPIWEVFCEKILHGIAKNLRYAAVMLAPDL